MSPVIAVKPGDRGSKWLTVDMRDEEGIGAPVVIPLFGPDHRGGMDCWCCPEWFDGVIVHNASH